VGVSRKEAAGRSNASEQAGQQARHPERAPYDLFRMRGTGGLKGVQFTQKHEGKEEMRPYWKSRLNVREDM